MVGKHERGCAKEICDKKLRNLLKLILQQWTRKVHFAVASACVHGLVGAQSLRWVPLELIVQPATHKHHLFQ